MYFLLWWYTTGLIEVITRAQEHARDLARSLHLKTLARYLFTPMFGYYDIGSRVISFFVRIIQFIVLLAYTSIYIALEVVFVLGWIALPLVIFGNIVYQLLSLWNQI